MNSLAPAALVLVATLGWPVAAASAQQPPAASQTPMPSELEVNRLVWSTIAAVDHANQAGNYSVLRDLAAPGFQANNDSARLAQVFAGLRASRIDLSTALLLAPTYPTPPRMVAADVMRVQGFFGLRPTAISFDLYYQWVGGRWRLFGVSIQPATLTGVEPQQPPPPPKKR